MKHPFVRNAAALVAGLVAAIAVFLLAEALNNKLHPLPAGTETKAAYAGQPFAFWAVVLIGWGLGSALCGYVIGRVGRRRTAWLPWAAGLALTASGAVNAFSLPHPVWFVVAGLLLFVPAVFAGYAFSKPKPHE